MIKNISIFKVKYQKETYIATTNIIKNDNIILYYKNNPTIFSDINEVIVTFGSTDNTLEIVVIDDACIEYNSYVHGILHREDGPAFCYIDEPKICIYYLNGKWIINEEKWFASLTSEQKHNYLWKL